MPETGFAFPSAGDVTSTLVALPDGFCDLVTAGFLGGYAMPTSRIAKMIQCPTKPTERQMAIDGKKSRICTQATVGLGEIGSESAAGR